jgi:hypothetical protein
MPRNSEFTHTNKEIPEYLIGQSLIWRCQGKNIPVTLKNINNQHGYSTVVLEKNVVLTNDEVLTAGKEIILANEELNAKLEAKVGSQIKRKKIKAPKQVNQIKWQW